MKSAAKLIFKVQTITKNKK